MPCRRDPLTSITAGVVERSEIKVLLCLAGSASADGWQAALEQSLSEKGRPVNVSLTTIGPSEWPNPSLRRQCLERIKSCMYDIILAFGQIETFDRKVFSNRKGVNPCRDHAWPRGFPWLERQEADKIASENVFIDFLPLISRAAHRSSPRQTRVLFFAPEDRGSKPLGEPASIWQFPEMKALHHLGFIRSAFFLCDFDQEQKGFPMASLSNIPEWTTHDCVVNG